MILNPLFLFSLLLAGTAHAHLGWNLLISSKCITGHENDALGPTFIVKGHNGKPVQTGGNIPKHIDIEVNSPQGIDSLEVTSGTPLIDRETNLYNGCASYLFSDATEFKSSNTYHVDLGNLKPGTFVFIQAFDGASGETIRGYVFSGTNGDNEGKRRRMPWL